MQEVLKLVRLEFGTDGDILIRFVSNWGKMDPEVSGIEDLVLEIERLSPDAVEISNDLYDRIGGIDTVNLIRDWLGVNVWFE